MKKSIYVIDSSDDKKYYQREELEVKGVNVGKNQPIIKAFLQNYLKKHVLFQGPQAIEQLARFLYNLDLFYVQHAKGYKKLKYSSILRELRKSLREIKTEEEAEKNEKRKRIKEIKEQRKMK